MFKRYLILVEGISTDIIVSALTEYSAREKYFNSYGSASRYSGIGMNMIEAKQL